MIGLEQELNTVSTRLGVVEAEKQMVQQSFEEKEQMLKEKMAASESSTEQTTALQEVNLFSFVDFFESLMCFFLSIFFFGCDFHNPLFFMCLFKMLFARKRLDIRCATFSDQRAIYFCCFQDGSLVGVSK